MKVKDSLEFRRKTSGVKVKATWEKLFSQNWEHEHFICDKTM